VKRTALSTPIVALLPLILSAVVSIPSVAQEKSHLVVRPGLIPDSLAGKRGTTTFDTARVRQNWDKLRKGQTVAEVQKLLGLPPMVHVDAINGWRIWWYGNRSVAFNSVTNRVSHWDEILDH